MLSVWCIVFLRLSYQIWQIGQLYVEIHGYFAPVFIIRIA